jgi:hypothetical protein
VTTNGLLAVVATIVALGFTLHLWLRHRARPGPATRAWLVGAFCYAVGVGCQAVAELGRLDPLLYRIWYLTGAFFVAAFLGAGSLYLAASPRVAGWAMRVLTWSSILVTPVVMTTPIDLGKVDPHLLTGDGFPNYVRLMTPIFNAFGTLGLVGVALWSAVKLGRGGASARFWSVALIAIGSLAAASGATLLRLGVPGGFYVGQLVGVVLMWLGFGMVR